MTSVFTVVESAPPVAGVTPRRCKKMNRRLMNCIGAVISVLVMNQCIATVHSTAPRFYPSPRLKQILTWPDDGGSVSYQARRFDEFQYRDTLTRATLGDSHECYGLKHDFAASDRRNTLIMRMTRISILLKSVPFVTATRLLGYLNTLRMEVKWEKVL